MMPMLTAALILGAFGTFHCVGMCGPLALALPVVNEGHGSRLLSSFLYNIGRTITYATLGVLLGLIGQSFSLIGFQQILSITAGAIILLMIIFPMHQKDIPFFKPFFIAVRKGLASLFGHKSYSSNFGIGLLNGFLPCGLVYVALAAATASGTVLHAALFMAAFGLGTLPVMWAFAFFGSYIQPNKFKGLKKFYPVLMGVMGLLLIMRGIGLDIPFISPAVHHTGTHNTIICHQ